MSDDQRRHATARFLALLPIEVGKIMTKREDEQRAIRLEYLAREAEEAELLEAQRLIEKRLKEIKEED